VGNCEHTAFSLLPSADALLRVADQLRRSAQPDSKIQKQDTSAAETDLLIASRTHDLSFAWGRLEAKARSSLTTAFQTDHYNSIV
jgi:hypothetical protein